MKYNYIATFQIRLLQCRYLSTKVTPLLRSLWPSPMGDRYRGVRLYSVLFLVCIYNIYPSLTELVLRATVAKRVAYIEQHELYTYYFMPLAKSCP